MLIAYYRNVFPQSVSQKLIKDFLVFETNELIAINSCGFVNEKTKERVVGRYSIAVRKKNTLQQF